MSLFHISCQAQIVDLLIKFAARDTTMTFGRVSKTDLRFPDLALCPSPGYKPEAMANLSLLDNPWEANPGSGDIEEVRGIGDTHPTFSIFVSII